MACIRARTRDRRRLDEAGDVFALSASLQLPTAAVSTERHVRNVSEPKYIAAAESKISFVRQNPAFVIIHDNVGSSIGDHGRDHHV